MMVARRNFLLGAAALLASPAVAKLEPIIGPISRGVLDSRLGKRWIVDVLFSCMATGEEIRQLPEDPVQMTIFRGEDPVFHVMYNLRNSIRWVAVPGSEIFLPAGGLCRVLLEPSHTHMALTMISNIDEPSATKRPRMFSEVFHWKDGETTLSAANALNPLDQHVLEKAHG